ncbi:MAG: outer membrane beta-barrel family protein, partial [Bacteroidales bacterium]|nr:outer membrane beta-barrel family protein [Bacteroidales bacterium]
DDYGEIASFTGYASGNSTKAINIITKEGSRNNLLADLSLGIGTNGHYDVENTLMYANGKHDLTILNDNNNVNKSRADMSDFKGFEAQVKSKMGMVINDDPLAGEQRTRNLAANYHFEPNQYKQLSLDYTFGLQENTLDQQSHQNYQDALFYDTSDTSTTKSQRHKLNLKYTYEKGDNKVIISEKFSHLDGSYQGAILRDGYIDETELNRSITENTTASQEFYSTTSAIWLHKFGESGRSLATIANVKIKSANKSSALGSIINSSLKDSIVYQNEEDTEVLENKAYARVSYKEPLSIFSNLNFVLSTTYGWSTADKEALLYSSGNINNSVLEDESKYSYTMNRAEIGYSSLGLKFVFNAGVGFEQNMVDKNFMLDNEICNQKETGYNWHPLIFGKYFLSSKQTVSFLLRSSTTMPTITQLQPTVTMNDPLKITVGNPNLEPGIQYMGLARYMHTNSEKSRFFTAWFFARYSNGFIGVENYFTNEAQHYYGYDVAAGTNVFMPVNLDGCFNIMSGADYAFPIRLLRSNINVGLSYTYSEIPTVMQNIEVDTQNHSGGLKLSLASNISQKVDFLVSHELSYNQTSNSQTSSSTQFVHNNLSVEGSFELIDSWKLGMDAYFNSYNYFNDYAAEHYTVLNASLTKQFLKDDRASLELRAYDILRQNQNVSFNIHETYTEQVQSNNLQQYFMLTFKYQF